MAADVMSSQLEQALKRAVQPLPLYLRKLAVGTVLILLSSFGFSLTILFLSIALFLGLANYTVLAYSALWCSLATTLIAALLLGIGLLTVRKPKN